MDSVVVVGAGPQGLAAAAHLLERGLNPLVLEAGTGPASGVAEWGHVRLFSPWTELTDAASCRLLEPTGWVAPIQGYPTGAQWIEQYLAPLAETLGDRIRYGARVVGVGRKGRDLSVDAGRAEQPFVVHVERADGSEERIEARAVIDASGTWRTPSPAGADGLSALGERAAVEAGLLDYRMPAIEEASALAGQHVVVVGNGHSAATTIGILSRVAKREPGTRITWVLRRGAVGNTFGGGSADELPERGALGQRAKKAVEDGLVGLVTGFRTEQVAHEDGRAVLIAEDGRRLEPAARVFVATGFRPDLSFLSEIRLDLDVRLQAPSRIAAEVNPNLHSCGSVRATGAADLEQPEPGFFIVGAKSYGRAPTFLALTGFEQVRSVVAAIAGDREAAERVDLVLPDTGVCGGSGLFDAPDEQSAAESCCAPAPQLIQLGMAPAAR
ncbi:NAD(P)-binding domain-containing protein [Microbacterium dextranolyticum]|uniref:Secreted protein n=1 Tax=Microbacterium dextranolyticum TaxID=36806 RepID=A0A9W6M771_9MICO|nr:NAD(P)-binding domain-containing protein [Microbacterium dextranolyticum]MBM7462517.1 thioredoxin reductase [Microbacterium dextranolyticum]GLJ96375.1 putative secreted protein [Microbacterium dextranolyticum]